MSALTEREKLQAAVEARIPEPESVKAIMHAADRYANAQSAENERFMAREFQDELAAQQAAAEGRVF